MPQVFGMEPRDDFRYARRSPGELKAEHILGPDVHVVQPFACIFERRVFHQGFQAKAAAAFHYTGNNQLSQRFVTLPHLLRERHQIESAEVRLDEIALCRRLLRKMADSDFAMLW